MDHVLISDISKLIATFCLMWQDNFTKV